MYVKHMKNNEHYDLLFFCAPPPPLPDIYILFVIGITTYPGCIFSWAKVRSAIVIHLCNDETS